MYDSERRKKPRGFSLAPFVLILLGVVFLLNNFGVLPWEIWQNIWKFWPVLLILFGVEILVGRNSSYKTLLFLGALIFFLPIVLVINPLTGNPLANSELTFDKPLGNLTKVEVVTEMPSNNIKITALEGGSDKVLSSKVKYSKLLPEPELSEEKRFGEAKYTFKQPEKYVPFAGNIGNSVDLKLSRLIPIFLSLKANAGVFDINLENLSVSQLEIETGTSKVSINFSKTASTKVFIKSAASQIVLTIPTEVQTQIKLDSVVENTKIDQNRFRKENGTYTTANFQTVTQKLQIEIIGSASSVEVR